MNRELASETVGSSGNYYQHSWSMLQECIAIPNAGTMEVLILPVIFHMHCGKGGLAWVLCGLAVRVVQAIWLHRRSPEDFDLNKADVHLRSQLWWAAYRLDGFPLPKADQHPSIIWLDLPRSVAAAGCRYRANVW